MRNMKGFVFTIDSIFALIMASAATSILIATSYMPPVQLQGAVAETTSISINLLQATMGQEVTSIPLAAAAVYGWESQQYTWPQYGNNASQSSSTLGFGPQFPSILFSYKVTPRINPAPAVADGIVVFTTNGVGSNLYAVNATTGSLVFNVPDSLGGVFISAPVIYHNEIYTEDSKGYIEAFTENGLLLWDSQVGGANSIFLNVEGGLVEANMSFVSPINGSVVIGAPTGQAAYGRGVYYSALPWNSIAVELDSYSLYGNTLTKEGKAIFAGYSSAYFTPVSADPNFIYLTMESASGVSTLYIRQRDRSYQYSYTLGGLAQGGAASFGNVVVVKTGDTLYGVDPIQKQLTFATPFPPDSYTSTPAITPDYVYTETYGSTINAYNEQTGALVWNQTLPSDTNTLNYNTLPSDIAIAYGNAYVVVGNVLYALGTCKADPQSSVLQTIATMYLNGQGGCATALLNQSYGSGKVAVMINNTYAPGINAGYFSSNSQVAIFNNPLNANDFNGNLTFSAWLYPFATQTADYPAIAQLSNVLASQNLNTWYKGEWVVYLQNGNPGQPGTFTTFNGLHFKYDDSSGVIHDNIGFNSSANLAIYTDKYVFIAYTVNSTSSTSTITLYMNGAEVSQYTGNVLPASVGNYSTFLGSDGYGNPNNFNGLISNVQLYNVSLSPSEVQTLWSSGIGGGPVNKSVVGWWPLQGDTADYSFKNHSGVPYNLTYAPMHDPAPGLSSAYQVGSATVPMTIKVGGTYSTYNVKVVAWR